eukprot:tig00021318_g20146.t1
MMYGQPQRGPAGVSAPSSGNSVLQKIIDFFVTLAREDKANLILFAAAVAGFFFAEIGIIILPRGEEYWEVHPDYIGLQGGIALFALLVSLVVVVGSGARHNRILLAAYGLLPMTIALLIYGAHQATVVTYWCRKCNETSCPTNADSCQSGLGTFMLGQVILIISTILMFMASINRREFIRQTVGDQPLVPAGFLKSDNWNFNLQQIGANLANLGGFGGAPAGPPRPQQTYGGAPPPSARVYQPSTFSVETVPVRGGL